MGTLTDVLGRALKFFSWRIALCSIVQASVSNFNLVEQRTITYARNVVRNTVVYLLKPVLLYFYV